MAMNATHVVRTHAITLDKPMPGALEYFTPLGELDWAEGWAPKWHWPPDGTTTAGMVFTTEHGGEHTIWTMTRYDRHAGVVEYVRATPGSRVGVVRVSCAPDGRRTRVEVSYTITTLTDAGRDKVPAEAAFAAYIESWKAAIEKL
jgi:hypothetical protein